MKLLLFFLQRSKSIGYSKGLIVILIVAGIVGGVSNTIILALINSVLKQQGPSTATLMCSFFAICALLAISKAISQIMLMRFAKWTACDLRTQLSRQILASPLRDLEAVGSNRLIASLTDDIPKIVQALTNLPNLCINIVIVLGCLVYMGWLSWVLLLLLSVVFGVGGLGYSALGRRAYKYVKSARETWDLLLKHFHSLIDGSKELKLHRQRREEFFSQNIKATAATLARHRIAAWTNYVVAENWGQMLIFVVVGLLIFNIAKIQSINAEVLTGYVIIILYMTNPLQFVLNTLPMISMAEVAIKQINELSILLESKVREDDAPSPANLNLSWKKINLVGVTHTYPRERENGNFTLGPINLKYTPGETVFITGGNGSGKTTLIKLIAGLYSPEDGNIVFDGRPVTSQNRDYYRQHFSAVFSDFYLFDSLYGLDNPGLDEQARAYMVQLQLDHKVQIKNGSLSTTNLSQGQRKRLALLTAYLEDRPIYIFDEWAADQDPLFKDIFYLQFLPELKSRGKTALVVSHDDRYYYVADRLIKLEYGQVISDRFVTVDEKAERKISLTPGTSGILPMSRPLNQF